MIKKLVILSVIFTTVFGIYSEAQTTAMPQMAYEGGEIRPVVVGNGITISTGAGYIFINYNDAATKRLITAMEDASFNYQAGGTIAATIGAYIKKSKIIGAGGIMSHIANLGNRYVATQLSRKNKGRGIAIMYGPGCRVPKIISR